MLLQQKWCRIIMSFRQITISGPETCQIEPKLWLQSCPDLLLPVQEDKSWSAKQASFFFLQKLHLSNLYLQIYHFYKIIWSFKKIRCFVKQIHDFYYCWLHKLRNTQGKIYGTYWENIYIYIYIYMDYIRNI